MILAIDYGLKRIGVAISDSNGIGIRVLPVISVNSTSEAKQKLLKIINDNDISTTLFGLPLDENGENTDWSEEVEAFATDLANESDITIEFINEFYSSKFARSMETPVKYSSRKKIDSIVAKHLLLSYFESKS